MASVGKLSACLLAVAAALTASCNSDLYSRKLDESRLALVTKTPMPEPCTKEKAIEIARRHLADLPEQNYGVMDENGYWLVYDNRRYFLPDSRRSGVFVSKATGDVLRYK